MAAGRSFACARGAWMIPLEGMAIAPMATRTPPEESLAVNQRLTKYAQREVHDLTENLAASTCVSEGDG